MKIDVEVELKYIPKDKIQICVPDDASDLEIGAQVEKFIKEKILYHRWNRVVPAFRRC